MGKVFAEDYLDLFCEIHRIHDNKLLYTGHIAKINDVEKYVVVSGLTAFSGEKPEEVAIAIISRFRGISTSRSYAICRWLPTNTSNRNG